MSCSSAADLRRVAGAAAEGALRLAGGARGVDHRGPGLDGSGGGSVEARRHQVVGGCMPVGRRAVEDEDLLDRRAARRGCEANIGACSASV